MTKRKKQRIKTMGLISIIIILLVLIGILLCQNKKLQESIPFENGDIFEINCKHDEYAETVFKENVVISDFNFIWDATNSLNIFSNPMYEMDNIIAPESTNVYQFAIKNNTSFDILYDMNYFEENDYGINMRYRLKRSSDYLIGSETEWVSYDNLMTHGISLKKGVIDIYYLEWKWFSGENDTAIGENADSKYALKINIKAKANE